MKRTWRFILFMIFAVVLYNLYVIVVVASDFATSVVPGWHTTIYPPWFWGFIVFSTVIIIFLIVKLLKIVLKKSQ